MTGAVIADLKEDNICEVSLAQMKQDSDDDVADTAAGDKGQSTQSALSPRPLPTTDVAKQLGDREA